MPPTLPPGRITWRRESCWKRWCRCRTGLLACPWTLTISRLLRCMGGTCFSLPGERSSPRQADPEGTPASPTSDSALSREELQVLFGVMERVYLPRAVSRYISRLVAASHPGSPEATAEVSK